MSFGTLVNSGQFVGAGVKSVADAISWTPTVGNFLVIAWGWASSSGGPAEAITDNYGNTYSRVIRDNEPGFGCEGEIWFGQVKTTGASFTITVNTGLASAPGTIGGFVREYTADPSSAISVDASTSVEYTGTAPSASLSNASANALYIAYVSTKDTSATATMTVPTSPWANPQTITNGTTGTVSGCVDQLVASVASRTATFTTDSTGSAILVVTFKETTTIAVNDANVYHSPGAWRKNGATWIQAATGGSYIKMGFTGTSITVKVDVSPLTAASAPANDYPVLAWQVDTGAWGTQVLTSATSQVSLASGLSAGTHQLYLEFVGPNDAPSTDRHTPSLVCRITGFLVDTGSASAAPVLRSKRAIAYGDSTTEGFNIDPLATNKFDNRYCWVKQVAEALNAEIGVLGYGSQRLTAQAAGGGSPLGVYPTTGTGSWDHYDDTTSRLPFEETIDYFLILLPHNDFSDGVPNATVTTQAQGLLNALRAQQPNAHIFWIVPFSQRYQSAVTPPSLTLDSKMHSIDLGTSFSSGLVSVSSSWRSADGVHPNAFASMEAAALVTQKVQAALGGAGATSTRHYLNTAMPGIS